MPYDFFEYLAGDNERVPAMLIYFSQGCEMMISYTSIMPAWFNRRNELTIYAGPIVIKAKLTKPEGGDEMAPSAEARMLADTVELPTFDAPPESYEAPPTDGFDAMPEESEIPTEEGAPADLLLAVAPDDYIDSSSLLAEDEAQAAATVQPPEPPDHESSAAPAEPSVEDAPVAETAPQPASAADESDPLAGLNLFAVIGGPDLNPPAEPAAPAELTAPEQAPDDPQGPPPPAATAPHPPGDTPVEADEAPPKTLGTDQTLHQFLQYLTTHRVTALFHLPEAGMFLEVFRLNKKGGLDPFEP